MRPHPSLSRLTRTLLWLGVCLPVAGLAQNTGWTANPDIVRKASEQQPTYNYDESRVAPYTLPDLLALPAAPGGKIETPADWGRRREAILELFRENVYGRSPGAPDRLRFEVRDDPHAMEGAATLRQVTVVSTQAGREHRFGVTLFLPNARRGRVPVFLLINNRPRDNTDPSRAVQSGFWPAERLIERGYGIAALQTAELSPDDKDRYREGVIQLVEGTALAPRPANAWRALAAWAWGARRAMDYLETDARVDVQRVAIVGHSRGGKAALWAGAEDERFALVVSNESGEGGAALSRRNFGETVARINEAFPHWFNNTYKGFAGREPEMPTDQHMLLALVAPRALYVASADADLWSDPRGEYLALVHASPIFSLWGDAPMLAEAMPPLDHPLIAGRRGYHVRTGAHNLTPYDWDRFADFADTLQWKSAGSDK